MKQMSMTEAPVEKLVLKLAVPTIITMIVTALYNSADTYFIGQTDTNSTASVGVAFSLMAIIQAIGFFFGHGSGNYMARKLGEGNKEDSDVMAITGILLSFIIGLIITVFGLLFVKPLCVFMGATKNMIETSVKYTSLILIAAPFMVTSFTMNNQLRFQGKAFLGMIGMTTGAILNVILDPIFIFGFNMGITGAALATAISQFISFVILLIMKEFRFSQIKKFSMRKEIRNSMVSYGMPSLIRQSVGSVAAVCINNVAGNYSEAVIAAVSIVNRITMIGASVVIGFGQGFQPVCGFNLGAKKTDRVIKAYSFCVKFSTIFMFILAVIIFIIAPFIIKLFRDDIDVIKSGTAILKYQCFTFAFQGVTIMTNMLLQNMGETYKASFLAIARQGIFFIPIVFALSYLLGLRGLEMSQAISDTLSFLVTIPMAITAIRKLKSE